MITATLDHKNIIVLTVDIKFHALYPRPMVQVAKSKLRGFNPRYLGHP